MGMALPSHFARRCPWADAMRDPRVTRWLSSYWAVKEMGQTLPGRQDPQFLSAAAVIIAERNAGDRDAQARQEMGANG